MKDLILPVLFSILSIVHSVEQVRHVIEVVLTKETINNLFPYRLFA